MPYDVAGDITGDTYDPVVNIPSNGETITEASLIDATVALGNRIEYVRKLTPLSGAQPDRFFLVRDDFTGAHYDSANDFIHSDLLWKSDVGAGTPSAGFYSGTSKNPGNLVVSLPSGATADQLSVALGFGAGIGVDMFSFAGFERIEFVFAVFDAPGNPGTQFQVGLCATVNNMAVGVGGTDSLRVRYSKAESANWIVNIRKASVGTQIVTAVPVVFGDYIVAAYARNAAGGIDVSIDGTIVTTVAAANIPAGEGTLGFEAFKSASDLIACSMQVDLVSGQQSITDRSGP